VAPGFVRREQLRRGAASVRIEDAAFVEELSERVVLVSVFVGGREHRRWRRQSISLPADRAVDEPIENAASLGPERFREVLVRGATAERARERNQVNAAPEPEAVVRDARPMVDTEPNFADRVELER